MSFSNREEAGKILANRMTSYATQNPLVLGLPRGGVPVAFEIATALRAPLDVFVVRKLGVPGHEELAMGAIATGGVRVLNTEVVESLQIADDAIETEVAKEEKEVVRRERLYRGERPPLEVQNRTVIVVDDGIATGSTIKAALAALKKQKVGRLAVAVPVAPPSTIEELKTEVDDVICLLTPEYFLAISVWYDEFPQITDEEVRELLKKAETQKQSAAVAVS